MENKKYSKRILALFLSLIMFIGILPLNAFAAVELPDWDKATSEKNLQKIDWELPAGTKIHAAGMAGVAISNFGVSFQGHFVDENGRVVLKGITSQRHITTAPMWKHIAFRFDEDLYKMIDFENSYIMSDNRKSKSRFTSANFIGKNEKVVPFIDSGSGSVHRPFYLVLKEGYTWDQVAEGGGHIVQTRLFNTDGSQVWSKHSNTYTEYPDTKLNYNTYTQSFPINNMIEERNKLRTGRIPSGITNYVDFVASRSLFLPDEGKLRVIYQNTHNNMYSNSNTEYKAFRQAFSTEFKNYLKPDERDRIANIYIKDHAFNPYGNEPSFHPIKMEDLNTFGNTTSFIVADSKFNLAYDDIKVSRLPAGKANDYIFSQLITINPVVTIVEYNVDTEKIEKDLYNNDQNAMAFAFDSMFLEDSQPVTHFEIKTTEDINVPTGSTVKALYDAPGIGGDYQYHANIMFGDNKALDLIYLKDRSSFKNSTGGKDTNGTEFTIDKGFKIPADTKVTIVNMDDNLNSMSDIRFEIVGPDGNTIYKETAKKNPAKFHEPEILQESDVISAGIIGETETPIIHEIFTDSKKMDGLIKTPNAWIYASYINGDPQKVEDPQKILAYETENFVPEGTSDDEKYEIPGSGSGEDRVADNKTEFISGQEFTGYPFKFGTIKLPDGLELKKDMPISFRDKAPSRVRSESVTEQVQAKVHFDLLGETSKIDGKDVIEKIAPLNKEYTNTFKEDGTVIENKDYKPSGFAKIEKGEVVGADNLRTVEDKNTVEVEQKLKDKNGASNTVKRTVINYLDHNDKAYDIEANDEKIKQEEIERLIQRQFPVGDEVNLPNAKRIIGWTTVKLEDEKDGKTAEEKFYELVDSKDEQGESNKIVTKLEDWEKASTEPYVFNEQSPIDKETTVYAVYGSPTIVLHSGVNDAEGKEIIKRIPITQSDIDNIDKHLGNLDATSQATVKKNTIIKEMPQVPYTDREEDVNKVQDSILKEFKKDNSTFIGWRAYESEEGFAAGNNNIRISALQKGEIFTQDGSKKNVPKLTESYTNLLQDKSKATLPNGFNFSFKSDDFNLDEGTVGAIIKNVKEVHLYAVYRPFFEITVNPQYKLVDETKGQYGEYVDGVEQEKQKAINIGLLYRTAVTGYNNPTVDASANYNPVGDRDSLRKWTPGSQDSPKWSEPGFDVLGQRRSYVSVVVPEGKEDAYTNFANPFSETSWSNLGISTYVKKTGQSLDPNAPKNLYNGESGRDPYGQTLAKTQSFEFENNGDVDAFTSATARKPILNDIKEVTGYDIVMTNALETLPTPEFNKLKDTDNKIKLKWGNNESYNSIDKVEVNLDGKTYTLTKREDGTFTGDNLSARVEGENLVITGIDLTDKGGKDIVAFYFKTTETGEMKSSPGSIRILSDKTSAPVEEMNQGVKENPNDKTTVEFMVPDKTLDQVGVGSKYTAEKWNPDTNSWEKVGEKELTEADKIADKFGGNKYTIELDNVKDGDKIRIVAEESNPNAESGYSKPAYSAGVDNDNTDAQPEEGEVFVTLDLTGPSGEIKGEDETFRRFVNLKGELSEIPDGQKVTLEINTSGKGKGDKDNDIRTFDTKDEAIEYLYRIIRNEEMPEMWIIAKDKFGNEASNEVIYEKTYTLETKVRDTEYRKKNIKVTSDMDGAVVKAEVFSGNDLVAEGTATVTNANEFVKLDLLKDGKAYRLQKGDRIHITAKLVQGDKTYTANPADKIVR